MFEMIPTRQEGFCNASRKCGTLAVGESLGQVGACSSYQANLSKLLDPTIKNENALRLACGDIRLQ